MKQYSLIERYRAFLPVTASTPIISLGEGNTPLLPLLNIPKLLEKHVSGLKIFVKYEGLNPTGSFKDRGMTMAVSKAVEEGSRAILCASTGNTSAASSAYAARANIKSVVIIPEGKIALGKLAQALIHGAIVLQIQGNFDSGMQIVKKLAQKLPITLVNSVNPYRLEGQKTAAFEIVDVLQNAPDYHAIPVGNAGNISAYWMGYSEYFKLNKSKKTPIMCGYQAAGAAPFVEGHPISNPETVATAIRIGNPQSWDKALRAVQESKGWFRAVSDDEILAAQKLLADREGIFCEPASAASIAGLLKDIEDKKIKPGSTICCTLTGHGLKDPDIAISQFSGKIQTVAATEDAVISALESYL